MVCNKLSDGIQLTSISLSTHRLLNGEKEDNGADVFSLKEGQVWGMEVLYIIPRAAVECSMGNPHLARAYTCSESVLCAADAHRASGGLGTISVHESSSCET